MSLQSNRRINDRCHLINDHRTRTGHMDQIMDLNKYINTSNPGVTSHNSDCARMIDIENLMRSGISSSKCDARVPSINQFPQSTNPLYYYRGTPDQRNTMYNSDNTHVSLRQNSNK